MANTLRVGVIGAGAIAEANHLPGYDRAPDVDVIAIADQNLDRAEAMAKKHAVPFVFQDYRELLRRDEIDAVSICTPNAVHAEHALAALRAGKHVLCEVPMALRLTDCAEMMRLAHEAGLVLMPALTYRFYPCHQRARQMIAEGAIGRPILFRARFANDGPYVSWSATSDWYYDPAQAGGGALSDQGVHALDLFRYHMGDADCVIADTACLLKDIQMEDHAALVLRGERVRGHMEASWSAKEVVTWVQIHGTGGILAIDCKTPLHLFLPGTGWQALTEAQGSGADAQMAHFVECCADGKMPIATAEDGMRAVGMLLAAYESAKAGKRVAL